MTQEQRHVRPLVVNSLEAWCIDDERIFYWLVMLKSSKGLHGGGVSIFYSQGEILHAFVCNQFPV